MIRLFTIANRCHFQAYFFDKIMETAAKWSNPILPLCSGRPIGSEQMHGCGQPAGFCDTERMRHSSVKLAKQIGFYGRAQPQDENTSERKIE